MSVVVYPRSKYEILKDLLMTTITESDGQLTDINFGSGLFNLLMSVAEEFEEFYFTGWERLNRNFILRAESTELDSIAADYGLIRQSAIKASGLVTLFGQPGAVAEIGTVEMFDPSATEEDVVYYSNIERIEFPISSGDESEATVNFECLTPGAIGKIAFGNLNEFKRRPSSVYRGSNIRPFMNGRDEESDSELQKSIIDLWPALSKGTGTAIEYYAKRVKGVTYAKVAENILPGVCQLAIGDSSGNSATSLKRTVSDSLEGNGTLQNMGVRPIGVRLEVVSVGIISIVFYPRVILPANDEYEEMAGGFIDNDRIAEAKKDLVDYLTTLTYGGKLKNVKSDDPRESGLKISRFEGIITKRFENVSLNNGIVCYSQPREIPGIQITRISRNNWDQEISILEWNPPYLRWDDGESYEITGSGKFQMMGSEGRWIEIIVDHSQLPTTLMREQLWRKIIGSGGLNIEEYEFPVYDSAWFANMEIS